MSPYDRYIGSFYTTRDNVFVMVDNGVVTHIKGESVEDLIEDAESDRFDRMQADINSELRSIGRKAVTCPPGKDIHNYPAIANIPLMRIHNRMITHIRSHDNTRWESVDEILRAADPTPIQQTVDADPAPIEQNRINAVSGIAHDESVRCFQEIVHRVNRRAERHSCRVRSVLDEWDRLMNGTRRRPSIARRAFPWVLAAVCGSGVLYALLRVSLGVL